MTCEGIKNTLKSIKYYKTKLKNRMGQIIQWQLTYKQSNHIKYHET